MDPSAVWRSRSGMDGAGRPGRSVPGPGLTPPFQLPPDPVGADDGEGLFQKFVDHPGKVLRAGGDPREEVPDRSGDRVAMNVEHEPVVGRAPGEVDLDHTVEP